MQAGTYGDQINQTALLRTADDIRGRPLKPGRSRSWFEKFIQAIADLPDPPCKGCPFYERCADERLACEQFVVYAETQESARPRWYEPTREPTRALYDLMFAKEDVARRKTVRQFTRRVQ